MITFTIEGITYQAEEGMTWGQWIDSKYNDGSVTALDPVGGMAPVTHNDKIISKNGIMYQYTNKIIENGYNYVYADMGSL